MSGSIKAQHRTPTPGGKFRGWRGRAALISAIALVGALVAAAVGQTTASPTLRIRGADISFTLQEEAINQLLSDNGTVAPLEKILSGHGANFARLRLSG